MSSTRRLIRPGELAGSYSERYFYLYEIAAMVKLAEEIAEIDWSGTSRKEYNHINEELMTLCNTRSRFDQVMYCLENMDKNDAVDIISRMDDDQKKYACGFFASLIFADGKVTNREIKLWQQICALGDFPPISSDEAIAFWENSQD